MSSRNGNVRIIDVDVAMTSGASYVTGDFVGTDGVALVFAGAAANVAQGGAVIGAQLINGAVDAKACELWLFDTAVTPPADSAAWTVSDADAKHLICVVPFAAADFYASGANVVCGGIPKGATAYKCASGATSIYGCIVARDTLTSPVLTIRLTVLQN
jgi:hypothetical protein